MDIGKLVPGTIQTATEYSFSSLMDIGKLVHNDILVPAVGVLVL